MAAARPAPATSPPKRHDSPTPAELGGLLQSGNVVLSSSVEAATLERDLPAKLDATSASTSPSSSARATSSRK